MSISRNANIRAMLKGLETAPDAHKYAVEEAVKAVCDALKSCGYRDLPSDDRLAEVEGVISNYLMQARA